jgi:hypothetical protein
MHQEWARRHEERTLLVRSAQTNFTMFTTSYRVLEGRPSLMTEYVTPCANVAIGNACCVVDDAHSKSIEHGTLGWSMNQRKKSTNESCDESLATRFWRSAKSCHARDLKHLAVLSELVQAISELVHALQKERGASSIYLGSNGAQFSDRLTACVADGRCVESRVRGRLQHVDEILEPKSRGARFCTHVAFALSALDGLPETRQQVSRLTLAPQDALKIFTQVIALLLAVGFDAADVAADADTSRALIALVNFAQGKEYAGQERAAVGAALSRGHFDPGNRRHLQNLQVAQERAFKTFMEFSDLRHVGTFFELANSPQTADFNQLREILLGADAQSAATQAVTPDAWYQVATRRIDAMKEIEDSIAADLARICDAKLAEADAAAQCTDAIDPDASTPTAPLAMLITQVDSGAGITGMVGGPEIYSVENGLPKPMRSILEVVGAQSRQIDDINSQLESARVLLAERKAVERAKGILMRQRRLSEENAYKLLRQTAMSQNKRILEVAEAIIDMAKIFRA